MNPQVSGGTGNTSQGGSPGQSYAAANSVENNYGIPATMPAPTVVNSDSAENAIQEANGNVANFSANVQPPPNPTATPTTTPASGSRTTTPTSPTGNTQTQTTYGSYTDENGQTSYYAQTGTDAQGNPTYASTPTDEGTVLNSGIASVPIPQPPTGGFYSPYSPGASVDSQGNIYGTSVPAALALGTSGDVANLNSQIAAGNTQIAQSGQAALTYLQQWQTGQIPLNPAQQSLVTSMTNQMNALIGLQQGANASYIGAQTENEARTGEERYNPTNAAAMVNQAVVKANLDLGALQAQQSQAIANIQLSFQKENYDEMLSANQQYQSAVEATQTTLENLSSQIQSSIESARTYNLNAQNQIFTQQMNSAQLSLSQKNDLFQNYMTSQNLSLAQSAQAEKYWNDQQTQAIAKLNVGVSEGELAVQKQQADIAAATFQATFGNGALGTLASGSPTAGGGTTTNGANATPPPMNADGSAPAAGYKYNASTGQFTDGAGNPITGDALSVLKSNLNTAGVHTYSDGLAYLDTSGYSNQDMATGAQNAARQNGILPLAPADASIVNTLESSKTQLTNLQNDWNAIGAPSSIITGAPDDLKRMISGAYGGSTSQAVSKYNTDQAALFDVLSSLSQSKRANGGEFEVGQVSLPTVSTGLLEGFNPTGGSTLQPNATAMFSAMTNQLNSLIASIVPGFVPQSTPSAQTASPSDLLQFGAGQGSTFATAPSVNTSITNNSAFSQ